MFQMGVSGEDLRVSPSVLNRGRKHFSSETGGFSGAGNSKMTFIFVSDQHDRTWSKVVVTRFLPDSRLF